MARRFLWPHFGDADIDLSAYPDGRIEKAAMLRNPREKERCLKSSSSER